MSEQRSIAGESFPSEYRRGTDRHTGTTIHQLTAAPCINHPPYFLTSALTPDERHLLFTSYRTGAPQLYETALLDGPIRQLTAVAGLHPYSAILTAAGEEVLYTRRDQEARG